MCIRSLAAPALAAAFLALPVHAQDKQPESRLIAKYEKFAGSESNARSLVEGLRNDSQVKLSARNSSTRFNPPTKPMGYGNVDHALALAKASLAEHGILKPTPEQIKAAMVGGMVTDSSGKRVSLPGVLTLRAKGMGWGQIAQRYDMKLGEVKRAQPDKKPGHIRPASFARPQKPERPQRPERPEKPERHGRR